MKNKRFKTILTALMCVVMLSLMAVSVFATGGGSGGRGARAGEKNRVFSVFSRRASRMYKEAAGSFPRKKPLTFSPGGVMDVSAGRETAQKAQPGTRVRREKPPPEERSPP